MTSPKITITGPELEKLIAAGLKASMMKHGIGIRKDREIMNWKPMSSAPKDRWIVIALTGKDHPYIVAKYFGEVKGEQHYRWAKVGDVYQTVTLADCYAWIDIPEYQE